jgi:acid phosphatase
MRKLTGFVALALAACAMTAVSGSAWPGKHGGKKLSKIDHVVVIYEENHSFDNLYGGWEGVNGRANAPASHTIQVNEAGAPYQCLLQDDVNLTSPPLAPTCTDTTTGSPFTSHFVNWPFLIDDYIKPEDATCPAPGVFAPNGVPKGSGLAGGCTRDIVHRFYQEQYQLNNGAQNRYTTGSDAVGLTQGVYDTEALPIYQYLHSKHHPRYAIADDFFQAAFGGSFLNHQWLVAASTPTWPGGPASQHSAIDSNGMPNTYPLYTPTGPVSDRALTAPCPTPIANRLCGDYAVNTIQPFQQPYQVGSVQLPAQTQKTIGDELSAKGISWAWYAGGWSNADGEVGAPGWTNGVGPSCTDLNAKPNPSWPYCPDKLFQFHHQPFVYYASFGPGMPNRAHLRDEVEFEQLAASSQKQCNLSSVSFIKPIGEENEHPGYTGEHPGSSHLVELLQSIENSACADNTMVVVTYDEFGGQWDHVSPPGQGRTRGPHDLSGPGTRIPALILSPKLTGHFVVDHTQYDTTSIDRTIEQRWGLAPLSSRDAAVNSLARVFDAHGFGGRGRDDD